jgi:uncharacterized phage protein gp47/JayE
MTDYGVTLTGFVVKPFADILNAKLDLARSAFGPDVDLRSTSALRKILDIASAEDQEHWKALEGGYYASFISTATGDALNVLGDDLGRQRANQQATGQVTFTLANEAPGRNYILPIGTLVETAAPVVRFRTTDTATLSSAQRTATLPATAVLTGTVGNVGASAIIQIDPIYASHYLSLGTATVAATNSAPFTGGDVLADDETYRAQLLRLPRTLFTVQAVSATVLNTDGVRDCRVSDPLGGVDVSLSIFNSFVFDRRRFGQARFLGTPYFFDVLVAPQPGYAWETIGAVIGLRDQVALAVDTVRPIGIFPNIRLADLVVVGVRANITTRPGIDAVAVGAALKSAFEQRVAGLGLGGAVLASEVLCDLLNVSGVVDVQNLHLRRNPPTFGSIVFGDREQFQGAAIEADLGANLSLTSNEIATFQYDSQLIDLRVSDR